ncbi:MULTISPECIES: hypothetical protein [unclassified Lentimonas]|uniref:hypothetical protein n=1 Tax=unclassified Lentimonas TaxID=2630993 RepID=UPI001327B08F|nr:MULTISPECIES: hypothetical protein [unclassified Lentimonas]CAA6697042.1 Unannotated [Lentimonas sp. CC19]CAA6697658.1 Unannotated [Lentimonas sp. CC10]CAA7069137.1 Unannotated [Lentimonas sp. CC11]
MNRFPKAASISSEEFDELWSEKIVTPLLGLGFKESGKSLFIEKNQSSLALIRLGGRMSRPGAICHTFCFRHTFLRNLKEEVPQKFEKEVFAYPVKSEPSRISTIGKADWHYTPRNLNYPREHIDFSKKQKNRIVTELQKLHDDLVIALNTLPNTLTPELLSQMIIQNGEAAWIEKMWLEDYENQTPNKAG